MEVLTDMQKAALEGIKSKIGELADKDFVEEILSSNSPSFTYNGVVYRVSKPNYEEKQKIYQERVKKFTELLRNKDYALEKDLKKSYLDRGIDIDEMTRVFDSLEKKKSAVQLKLGEALQKESLDSVCEAFRSEVEEIENKQRDIAMEKQILLECSIENQVNIHMYNYMAFIITEHKIGDKWEKAFKKFEEFMNSEEELIAKLAFLITMTTNLNN